MGRDTRPGVFPHGEAHAPSLPRSQKGAGGDLAGDDVQANSVVTIAAWMAVASSHTAGPRGIFRQPTPLCDGEAGEALAF